ncbi:MAG: cytidylate kinase-like family protein [Geminicoccaceae bacterium]
MPARVVCISRTLAGGGEEVGRGVAERLGYRIIDAEIIERAAERAAVDPRQVMEAEQRQSLIRRLISAVAFPGAPGALPLDYYAATPEAALVIWQPPEERLRAMIREVIREVANEGRCVIVAHAASMALAGREDVLRVLVTASAELRARRLVELSRCSLKEARAAVRNSDDERSDYFRRFYELPQELPTHYDLVVNTDALTPEQAVGGIVAAARA